MLTHEAQMDLLVRKVVEVLTEKIEKEVPAEGSFERIGVRYHHPESEFRGILSLEEDLVRAGHCRLNASMFLLGDDKLVSNYLMKGTRQEILNYLNQEETIPELIGIFEHLKEKVENLD